VPGGLLPDATIYALAAGGKAFMTRDFAKTAPGR
jgi:hypothetical protein